MDFLSILNRQKNYVSSGKTRSIKERIAQLRKLKTIIKTYEKKIITALKLDLNKSEYESYITEVGFIYKEIDHTIKLLPKWSKDKTTRPPWMLFPAKGRVVSEPFGSVLIMAPWNYPFQLVMSPLIAAVAAGNSAVLKPSELTSHVQAVVIEMINSNFEADFIYAVGGAVPECEQLLELPFDFIFFTGSPGVGKIVMRAAAENLVPVCLELGGKSPCIVDRDTNLEVAARRIAWGKYINAGQTCVAPDYVYVHAAVKEQFLQLLVKNISRFFGADAKASADYTRIINVRNFQRVMSLMPKENILTGGQADESSLYIAPTVVTGVSWPDPIMQEEIFGPILPVLEYEQLDEVISKIVSEPKPLALYVFTNNSAVKEKVTQSISYGGGCINDTILHLSDSEMPFGGVGNSGMGNYHGKYGFDLFSHKKSILEKSCLLDNDQRYPPYTTKKLSLLRRFL